MRNLILLKDFIKNILTEKYDRYDNASFDEIANWLEDNPNLKAFYEREAKKNLGKEFLLENMFGLTKSVAVYAVEGENVIVGIYFNLKEDALEKLGYEVNTDPWVGINLEEEKFLFENFSKKQKSDEGEVSGFSPEDAAALTSVVQTAQKQGARTPGEIADQVAQDLDIPNPGPFVQAIVPVVAAAAKSGFEDADLSSLPRDSQQAAKQVVAKSAKSGSPKTDQRKVIADFTREVIQSMNIKQNRKNVSVVDKTLKWLKSQDKLKAESANHSRTKIRNTL